MASDPPVPVLTDGVVRLDGFALTDVQVHVAGEDEETARRFGWYPLRSSETTVTGAIERWREEWQNGGTRRAWAVRDAERGVLLGGCELKLQEDGRAEMSYWTGWRHRGRGVAARAARLVCAHAFSMLDVERVELHIEVDNVASRRTAERAGFVEEGVLRKWGRIGSERRDMVLYSRLPTDP